MWQDRIARYLLAGLAERDLGFRQEVERLAHIGLRVVGGVQIAVAGFMLLARFLVAPDPETFELRLFQGGLVIALGIITLGLARVKSLYRRARALGLMMGVAVGAILVWFSLLMTAVDPSADDFIPGQVTLIMLVGVAALPLRPTDTLLFGFLVESIYVIASLAAAEFFVVGRSVDAVYVLFIFMLSLVATGLTAVLYEQRRSNYEAYLNNLRATEDLRLAESRNLLTQNAASVGRLAAALSHELNSPIGALVSGVDTLLLLASRQAASGSPQELQRLVVLQADVRRTITQSAARLKEIIARMQRFTNLDKAEIQSANVNDLLNDVTALLEPRYKGKAEVEMKLQPVPELVCRPQQLSAVFSNLLGNAIEALNGDGRIVICTREKDARVEIEFHDNGRGMDPKDVETIFDPGFKVTRGRVSTGNWSMFSSRQIINEHGGDIRIESLPGQGTRVCVVLPSGNGTGLRAT